MNTDAMVRILKSLKLFGMAQSVEELAGQSSPAYQQAVPILESLLKAEVAERDVRSIQYQMKAARFPAYRDLASFNFTQSTVDETLTLVAPLSVYRGHAESGARWRSGHWQNPPGYRLGCAGYPAPPLSGSVPVHD